MTAATQQQLDPANTVPAPPGEPLPSSAQQHVVRDMVSSLSVHAFTLYNSTKASYPAIEKLERSYLEPYKQPLVTTWKEHGDPLLSTLDTTVSRVNDKYVKPSEQYLRSSVSRASEKASAAEAYITTRRQAIHDQVSQRSAYVEQSTREALDKVLGYADDVIDRVLPELDEQQPNNNNNNEDGDYEPVSPSHSTSTSTSAAASSSSSAQEDFAASKLTKKVAKRLRHRANDIYAYSSDRAKEIVHIDLIAYARDAFDAFPMPDEKRMAKAFDKVLDVLPNHETTTKMTEAAIKNSPSTIKPVVTRGVQIAAPWVDYSFDSALFLIIALRKAILDNKNTSKRLADNNNNKSPVANENDDADADDTITDTVTRANPSHAAETKTADPEINTADKKSSETKTDDDATAAKKEELSASTDSAVIVNNNKNNETASSAAPTGDDAKPSSAAKSKKNKKRTTGQN